jgi:hypothetical protein
MLATLAFACARATRGKRSDRKRGGVVADPEVTQEYCRQRRLCSHCGSQRPLKDVRARRLLSVFGTVEVRAPRFLPCRCAVTRRHTLNRSYQVRSFEVMLAQVSNDDGKQLVFSSMPAVADRQREQLRGVLRGLGAMSHCS